MKYVSLLIVFIAVLLQACNGGDSSTPANETETETELQKSKITILRVPTSQGEFDGLTAGPKTGVPVILLHGFPSTAEQFNSIIKNLADEGYYVIAPNQRGFSEGVRPTEPEAYHPSLRTQDVIDIANQLDIERFHLVGHNSGALTSWIVSSMHPDRVITLTAISVAHPQAIVDVALSGDAGQPAERAGYAQDFTSENFEETFVANDHEYMRWVYEDSPQESIDLYVDKLGDVETVDAILNYYRERDWGWILTNGARTIVVPTLQIWGDNDSYVTIATMALSENYVTAEYRFEILEGISHWVTETAEDDVSALLLEHFEGRN